MNSKIYILIDEWCEIVDKQGTFAPKVIVEVGSMNGVDADKLAKHYDTKDVYIIEAHKAFAEKIALDYPEYNVFNFAATNFNGITVFNCVTETSHNLGMSSILDREDSFPSWDIEYVQDEVVATRMDLFCESNNISHIDMLKIDVEGNTFEVLEGFGEYLSIVRCIHLEAEHTPVWKGQKLYADIEKYLIEIGFIPVEIKIGFPQSDSVWVNKEYYNPNWSNL